MSQSKGTFDSFSFMVEMSELENYRSELSIVTVMCHPIAVASAT